jgi:hypothetical protein
VQFGFNDDDEIDEIFEFTIELEFNFEKAFSRKSKFGGVTGVFDGAQNFKKLINEKNLKLYFNNNLKHLVRFRAGKLVFDKFLRI